MTECTVLLMLLGLCAAPTVAADATAGDLGYLTLSEDSTRMAAVCPGGLGPGNLVVIVTVRGSGEEPRKGALRTYRRALARDLAERGYQVTTVEIDYPALPVKRLFGHVPEFLRSAVGSGPEIAGQLAALTRVCRTRKVVIAAYSQGGIALRAAVSRLPRSVWSRFAAIDLFGDGSAASDRDQGMPNGPTPLTKAPARRRTLGIWMYGRQVTAAAKTAPARAFATLFRADNLQAIASMQLPTSYPDELKPKIDRYCAEKDPVCDTRRAVAEFADEVDRIGCKLFAIGWAACATESGWARAYVSFLEGQHRSYRWRLSALDTAAGFPTRLDPTPPFSPLPPGPLPNLPLAFTDVGVPGAALVQRPPAIAYSSVGACNPRFEQLTWSEWGPARAVATGIVSVIVSQPTSCAAAIRQSLAVTLTLSDPLTCAVSGRIFTRMTWTTSAGTETGSSAYYCDPP